MQPPPRRLKLTIAYDGRPFAGWQVQPNADTIQQRIESAIAEVAKQALRVHGSGRTDTGVHALAQTAHFDCPPHIGMNPYNWVPAINTKLPATIRVTHCEEVDPSFHARFSASAKTYQFDLCLAPILPPLRAGLAWHLPRQLDPATLHAALAATCGTHDFRAFAANRGNESADTDFIRTISRASVTATDDGYQLTFTGNGFLYRMVRLLTGAAVHAAQGRFPLADFIALLNQPAHLPLGKSPLCAPPDGLTLVSVDYQPHTTPAPRPADQPLG